MYVWRGEVVEEAARWPSHPPSGRSGREPRPCGSGKRRGGIRPTSDSTAESLHFGACVIDFMVVRCPGRARVDLIIISSPGKKVCREVKKKKTAVIPVWPLQAEIRKNKTSGLDPPFRPATTCAIGSKVYFSLPGPSPSTTTVPCTASRVKKSQMHGAGYH